MRRALFLRFADKFLLAPGAGDGDFALAPGNPDGLAALGAVEIAVVPVLEPVKDQQEFPVLLVALVGIPGEGPEDGPEHQPVAEGPENGPHRQIAEQGGENAGHQAGAQNDHIQPVRAVPARHKAAQSGGEPSTGLAQPHRQFIHPYHLIRGGKEFVIPIILRNSGISTAQPQNLRIV